MEDSNLFTQRCSVVFSICFAALAFSSTLKGDENWNFNYSGSDGYGDTLSITGTISTAPGSSPLTIESVNLSYKQVGVPGAPNIVITDSSNTLESYANSDNLLYTNAPFIDGYGISFLLASGSGGSDSFGDVNLSFDSYQNAIFYPNADDPPFLGSLSVTEITPNSVPEPSSASLFVALGLLLMAISAPLSSSNRQAFWRFLQAR